MKEMKMSKYDMPMTRRKYEIYINLTNRERRERKYMIVMREIPWREISREGD